MLCWSIISLASFLLLVSLDGTICGTLPRYGVNLKPLSVPEAPAARIIKTIVDSHIGRQGHNSQAEPNIPAKDQSSMHMREKPLTDMVGSNDTHDKTASAHPQDTHSVQQSSFVAFTVSNDGPDQGPYADVKVVTFNKVITNTGGGFDPMFSVFTCKVSGHYFFSVSLLATSQRIAKVVLVLDGRNIVDAYGNPPHHAAVLSAYLHVVAGARVWVSLPTTFAVHGRQSTFSGSLVRPDAAT